MFGWLLAGIPSDSSTLLDLLGAAGGGVGFGVRRLQWVATSYVFLTAVWHAVGIALGAATALVLAAVAVQPAVLVAGVAAVDGHVRAEAPSLTPTIGRRMWSALWTVGERAHALWGNEAFRCSVWLFAWTAAATAAAAARGRACAAPRWTRTPWRASTPRSCGSTTTSARRSTTSTRPRASSSPARLPAARPGDKALPHITATTWRREQ